MRCDEREQRLIRTLLRAFERRDVEYVVPRGHQDLPESFPGSDLDVYVDEDAFERATTVCAAAGLEPGGSAIGNVRQLVVKGVREPRAAATLVLESPDELVPFLRRRLSPGAPTRRGLAERHFVDGELDVHLFNHLAYTSPLNGAKIRVDPAVEQAMLDRRVEGTAGWIPAPPDELVHLVCRGVFDYGGTFPTYYERRCDRLAEAVVADGEADEQFRRTLEPLFFAAAGLVYDHVLAGEYDDIRSALYRFSDY